MSTQRKKVVVSVYLTAEQQEALQALSASTMVPVAAYLRRGVDMVLAEQHERQPVALVMVSKTGGSK